MTRLAGRPGSFSPSGGSISTVLALFDHFSVSQVMAVSKPYSLSPVPHPEKARPSSSLLETLSGLRTVPDLGVQTTSILASSDGPIVERTGGLLSQIPTRKDEFYGPSFTFAEYLKARNWLHGIAIHWGMLLGLLAIRLARPVRTLVQRFVYEPGQGIGKEDMAKEAFCRARFHGSMYQRESPSARGEAKSPSLTRGPAQ